MDFADNKIMETALAKGSHDKTILKDKLEGFSTSEGSHIINIVNRKIK